MLTRRRPQQLACRIVKLENVLEKSVPSISDNLEHICIFRFVKNYRIPYTPHLTIILKKVDLLITLDDGQAIKFRPPILCQTTKQGIISNVKTSSSGSMEQMNTYN